MKKLLLLLCITLLIMSCQQKKQINCISLQNGEYITVIDTQNLTKVNDSLIIRLTTANITSSLYGKYTGTIPESFTYKYGEETYLIYYKLVKRIK